MIGHDNEAVDRPNTPPLRMELANHPSAVNGRPIGHSRSRPIGHSQLPIPHLAQRLGLVSELKRHGGKLGLLVFGKHKRLTSRNLKVDQ